MTVAVPWIIKGLGIAGAAAGAKAASKTLKVQQTPAPEPPTIDDAAKMRDGVDRIRRRRGVLANIFGGNSAAPSTPSVGVKTLTGQ